MNADESQPRLELCLLGGIELRGAAPGAADALLAQAKPLALLAFLALSPASRYQRRDRLVGLLWPDLDQQHARAALRKALHELRTALGAHVLSARGDDEIALAPGAMLCDVVEFTAAVESRRLARALEIYRGDLMPGFYLSGCVEYERWLEDERTAARERAAAASWALAVMFEGEDRLTDAGVSARRAVRHAWTDERVLRRAMTLLDRLGDRAGAVKLYEEFSVRVRADLDVEPSAETTALANAIRSR
jgi:DNA-binding SARP family transcriptional activator